MFDSIGGVYTVWTGTRRFSVNGVQEWKHRDGSLIAQELWYPGDPNNPTREACAGLWYDGSRSLVSDVCSYKHQFLCEDIKRIHTNASWVPACPDAFYLYEGFCYQFFTDEHVADVAGDVCKTNNSLLVSLHHHRQMAFLSNLVGNSGKKTFFVGLKWDGENNVWNRSDGSQMYYSDPMWDDGEPTNEQENRCGTLNLENDGAVIRTESCNTSYPFFCQKRACPPGYYGYEFECFRIIPVRAVYEKASEFCDVDGAVVARVSNSNTQQFLESLAKKSELKDEEFWIDPNSGIKPNIRLLGTESCVSLGMSSSIILQVHCSLEKYFVCQIEFKDEGKTRVTKH
ncbi:C-type mannose receptor 2-like [Tachypleus tridentatus]|uniref:C-type mannose receptor 2-like n=1 Tax=Tachypleus tridentatus TaxID=6853 RepID=UPI003FD3FD1B